jgi:hypothetical protein
VGVVSPAEEDAHMSRWALGRPEEHQVPRPGSIPGPQESGEPLLIGGIPRELVSLFPQEELGEAGTVDPGRSAAAPEIRDPEQIAHPGDQARRPETADEKGAALGPAAPTVGQFDLPMATP